MVLIDEKTWAAVLASEDTELDPPASEEAIASFETIYGFKLPPAHREFLLRANGGVVGYSRLFGVGRSDALDLNYQLNLIRADIEEMADGPVLPFANDWGGSYFCYDLQKQSATPDYPVLYWNHEYSEEPEDRPLMWSVFAPDFLSFVLKVIEE